MEDQARTLTTITLEVNSKQPRLIVTLDPNSVLFFPYPITYNPIRFTQMLNGENILCPTVSFD